jgi:hypothetical protein
MPKIKLNTGTPQIPVWTDIPLGGSTGVGNVVIGEGANAEGQYTTANGDYSHTEGSYTVTGEPYGSPIAGTYTGNKITLYRPIFVGESWNEFSAGDTIEIYDDAYFLMTTMTVSSSGNEYDSANNFVIGYIITQESIVNNGWAYVKNANSSKARNGNNAFASGSGSVASGEASMAANGAVAKGEFSFASGGSTASGDYSSAEGFRAMATNLYTHAEGLQTWANGVASHAEGQGTKANGNYSHSEGFNTSSIGNSSHAEGDRTVAASSSSHAEGILTTTGYKIYKFSNIDSTTKTLTVNSTDSLSRFAVGDPVYFIYYSNAVAYSVVETYVVSVDDTAHTVVLNDMPSITGVLLTQTKNQGQLINRNTDGASAYSHSEGSMTGAYGRIAHAEGDRSIASGASSHAEGSMTLASGANSHAEGSTSQATGSGSHAEGGSTTASGDYSHSEGTTTTAAGNYSHAEGMGTKANSNASHAEGTYTGVYRMNGHAEGLGSSVAYAAGRVVTYNGTTGVTVATGEGTQFASGNAVHLYYIGASSTVYRFETTIASISTDIVTLSATPSPAVVTPYYLVNVTQSGSGTINSNSGHAEGFMTLARGSYSHVEGMYNTDGGYSGVHVMGQYGDANAANAFFLANGTSISSRGLAVKMLSSGAVTADSAYASTGADYAEMFEWEDENIDNEDRVGYFVTLDGEKIRKADSKDQYIVGIVSATPSIIGDAGGLRWQGKYVTDAWGRTQYQTVTIPAIQDTDGNEIVPESQEIQPIHNPDWDNEEDYVDRNERKEWSAVGMMGKLLVRDDGSCVVNGYCKSNDEGIATISESGYRVMKRVTENIILVLVK